MMNFLMHRKVRSSLYELATGENRDAQLIDHANTCDRCRLELQEMRETLSQIDASSYDPAAGRPELYWQMFPEKVERRLSEPAVSHEPGFGWFGSRPAFLAGAATALGTVVISLGVFWWTSRQEATTNGSRTAPSGITNVRERTYDYLDRSKVVLLGVLHADAEDIDRSPEIFGLNRDASRQLVDEARQLTGDLTDPRDQRLRQLVTDLQVILIELANLDSGTDVPELEIIQESVKRKGVLLKITIEEMNKASGSSQASPADNHGTDNETRSL